MLFPVYKPSKSLTLLLGVSFAQAPLAADNTVADTLVVTASRSAESQQTLPVAITSVDHQQLELDQVGHIQEVTRQMAGVTINQLSGSSSHNTGIRMPLNYDGYYLFLQDSVPLQSSAFFNHNGLRWSSVNTSAEQIEVLKGAGTTLYGSGAVAATVNVLSEQPTFYPQGNLRLLAGEDDYGQLRLQHSDAISETQALLFSASSLKDGGWRDNSARKRHEMLLKHLWQPSDDTELKTQLQLSRSRDEMASSLTEQQYRSDPSQSGLSAAVEALQPERESDFARLSLELEHQLSERFSFSLIPYMRHNTNDYIATWRSYTPKGESQVDTLGLLAKGRWQHDTGSETLFGLDLEHSRSDNLEYQPLSVTVSNFRGATTEYTEGFKYRDQNISYRNISPYLQHNMHLSDALQLQLGARYDLSNYQLKNHLAETDNDGFGNRQLADRSDKFHSFNPKLGLYYALDKQSGVYARLAQANRLPSASSLYNLRSGDSGSLVGGVDEETSLTAEIGYRYLHKDLSLSLALYRMDIDDAIVSAYDAAGDSYRTNAGKTRHQGVELELGYAFSPELSTRLALSHSKHEYIDFINLGNDYSGNEIQRAPRNKVGASISFTPAASELAMQLQMDHFGSYWKDESNSDKASSYTLFHLKGQYQIAPELSLYGRIDNLFDRQYAYQNEIRYGRDRFYPGAGRTLKAGIKYSW